MTGGHKTRKTTTREINLPRMDSNHDKVIQSHLSTAGLAPLAFWSVIFECKKLATCERKIASSRFQRLLA
jgi:hypothetical protein